MNEPFFALLPPLLLPDRASANDVMPAPERVLLGDAGMGEVKTGGCDVTAGVGATGGVVNVAPEALPILSK